MKKITLLFTLFIVAFLSAQNSVTIDGSKTWKGYVNAFNTSDDSYAFGFEYGVADLKTTIEASTITLQPNFAIWTAENTNASWFDNATTPNKYIETSSYVEDNTLAGTDLNFSGNIDAHTIDSGYTVVAFIKALDPNSGYATVVNESMTLTSGVTSFSISATAAQLVSGYIIQYGFSVKGALGNPDNESTLGSVVLSDGNSTGATSSNDVSIDGSKTWKGYVNAFNTSDDSYAFGFEYGVADLKTTIEASIITLQPNFAIWTAENTNASWFDNTTTPNKYIEASSFVENNALAGADLNFSGKIDAHTIDSGYTVVAFIKALDPNSGYATVVNENMTLTSGVTSFSVSATAEQLVSGYIIQYGFSVKGALGNPDNESSLGSVVLSDGSSTSGGGSASNYCEKVVTHFGIEAETASAIKLTIENSGTKTMKVTIESNDSDAVDEIVIPAVTGAPTVSAKDESVSGKISVTLTWENTPTDDIDINVLWSKVSFEGNWQLKEDPVTVKFDSSCETASLNDSTLSDISLYPNPVSNILTINTHNVIKNVVLYNILGKQVMYLQINKNNKSIDVSNLSKGVYLIKYQVENTVGTAKFIKQ
ncbi:T9SS type A sorting domain-containing protein [uncultured Polaribacter sp.]|uniref:T9SS type A sorting domain-containing protein n=1 Tax=uncultured Polaribacter sp. TaxID=174711 RepID=UPI00262D4A29|nr:T9SS type A sorting domain-containing protein [uncultured Polaribacter sp.]